MFDTYQNAPFSLKVNVLIYVLDYPGISKVFNVKGVNAYQGCAWCELEGNKCVRVIIALICAVIDRYIFTTFTQDGLLTKQKVFGRQR